MAVYEQYPRGAMLVSHTVPPKQALPGEFVIGYMGSGASRSTNFTALIQVAADAGKPFLAFYENDPGLFLDQYQSLNPEKWQENPGACYAIAEVIRPQLMAGEAMRTVHGVIIGMNKLRRANDQYVDAWYVETARFLAWAIWTLFKLPVWFYIDPNNAAVHKDSVKFQTFLAQQEGVSTYHDCFSQPATVTALPVPPDEAGPALKAKVRESGLGHAPRVHFWCYSTGDYSIEGITGVVPLFTYLGSKAELYDVLGWKAPVTPPPVEPPDEPEPPDPDEPEPPATEFQAAVLARLDAILAELRRERTIL